MTKQLLTQADYKALWEQMCDRCNELDKRLAQLEPKPVAWLCLIAEADFSADTVTLAMQCTDYKVSTGKHWLSNTPPQRKESK